MSASKKRGALPPKKQEAAKAVKPPLDTEMHLSIRIARSKMRAFKLKCAEHATTAKAVIEAAVDRFIAS